MSLVCSRSVFLSDDSSMEITFMNSGTATGVLAQKHHSNLFQFYEQHFFYIKCLVLCLTKSSNSRVNPIQPFHLLFSLTATVSSNPGVL